MKKMKSVRIPSYIRDHQANWAITYDAAKKMETFVKEVLAKEALPVGFMDQFEADARAFGINAELYMLSECSSLVWEVLRAFDLSACNEIRLCAGRGKNGTIFRRNCQAEPFWRKEDMTPARERKIRAIREQNRKLAKAA